MNSGFVDCDKNGIEWNASKGYWIAKNTNYTSFKNNGIGCNADAFLLVDFDDIKSVKTSQDSNAYSMGGLWRWFHSSIANNNSFSLTINSATPNPPTFIYGGYTMPVNYVLYGSGYQTDKRNQGSQHINMRDRRLCFFRILQYQTYRLCNMLLYRCLL